MSREMQLYVKHLLEEYAARRAAPPEDSRAGN
jgi:hypothetical protein